MTTSFPARVLCAGLVLSGAVWHAGCRSCEREKDVTRAEPGPAHLAGMDAVPHDVEVILGGDVAKLRGSWLVNRAVEQMFRRDPELAERVRQLTETCKLDPGEDIERVIVAWDRRSDDAIMVLTGTFVEAELTSCANQIAAAGGGTLTFQEVGGRTFYRAGGDRDRQRDRWFTVPGPRTLVVATSSEALARAVGPGDKIAASPQMSRLLARIDQKAGLWGVGLVDEQVGAGLVEVTRRALSSPPRALFAQLDLSPGLALVAGAEMSAADDAKHLASFVKAQLSVGAWALQQYGLGEAAKKLGVDLQDETVYLRLSLTDDEVKELLAQIDTSRDSAQDSPKIEE